MENGPYCIRVPLTHFFKELLIEQVIFLLIVKISVANMVTLLLIQLRLSIKCFIMRDYFFAATLPWFVYPYA